MRISDWSADVCSSDLDLRGSANLSFTYRSKILFGYRDPNTAQPGYGLLNGRVSLETQDGRYRLSLFGKNLTNKHFASFIAAGVLDRSEEHTSELQSLMSISYALFCLKKKKTTN